MKVENHIKEILTELAANNVKFIVCGGLAAVLHGVERMTMDIDISIDYSEENYNNFLDSLNRLNLSPKAPFSPEKLKEGKIRKDLIENKNAIVFSFVDNKKPYKQLDIFLSDENSYQNLIKYAVKVPIEDKEIYVISIEKLIEIKSSLQEPREKDVFDIKMLKQINETKKRK